MAHIAWKGYLKISLVTVPVKAFAASESNAGQISLNQLHEPCKSRIKYKKTCPIHGEVTNDAIVSGYEYQRGQYVVVDPDELENLRTENDRSISVGKFVNEDSIDPLYHEGKSYFLLPDGPVGQKPYQLLHRAMKSAGVAGIAQVVLSKREQLVAVRPIDRLLVMTVLKYAKEVRPVAEFTEELVEAPTDKAEVELTGKLINALTAGDFDPSEYHDAYIEKLTHLIEAKVEGKEIVAPKETSEPHVINLMDAIRKSVEQIKRPSSSKSPQKAPGKPARQAAGHRNRKRKAAI